MAITVTTAMPTSFKVELFKGLHDLQNGADTLKIALLKATASGSGTYGAASTNYSDITGNSDETSGTGYSAGGNTLTNVTLLLRALLLSAILLTLLGQVRLSLRVAR